MRLCLWPCLSVSWKGWNIPVLSEAQEEVLWVKGKGFLLSCLLRHTSKVAQMTARLWVLVLHLRSSVHTYQDRAKAFAMK